MKPRTNEIPASSVAGMKRLSGDGLRLKMQANRESLWIDGDGCYVKLEANYGLLRVTGDGCRVRIERNAGRVEYFGDGGRVLLGPESELGKVEYKGNGGQVERAELSGKCRAKEPVEESNNNNNNNNVTVRRTFVRNGKLVSTDVTTVRKDRSFRHTATKTGSHLNISVVGVNGKRSGVHEKA